MSAFFPFVRCLVFALFLSVLGACEATPPSGAEAPRAQSTDQAIIGGSVENGREAVVIVLNRQQGGLCTGTVVADRVVLTAKHCVQQAGASEPVSPAQLGVGVGSSLERDGGDIRWLEVARITATPGVYIETSQGIENLVGEDLAVVALASSAGVTPLPLRLSSPHALVGTTATAVGFGQTPSGGLGVKYSVTTEIEALQSRTIQVDGTVCQGDSGGPLISADGEVFGVVSFGTTQGCGGGPSYYQRVDVLADFLTAAINGASDCSNDGSEVCDGLDNDCDGVIDEGCAARGDSCEIDAECTTRLCAEGICTVPCDPAAGTGICPSGMACVAQEQCAGVCLPARKDGKSFGERCSADSECESRSCVDPGNGEARCATSCRVNEGACFALEACFAADGGSCGTCVNSGLVAGKLGTDEPCQTADRCYSELCFDDGGTKYCTTTCSADADCSADQHCRDGACVRGRRAPLGGACRSHDDCAFDAFCFDTDQGQFCSQRCDESTPCNRGFICRNVANGKACFPEKQALGADCEQNDDCVSGRCHEASKSCTRLCNSPSACGVGFDCIRTSSTEGLCLSPDAAAADPALGQLLKAHKPSVIVGDCAVSQGNNPLSAAVWVALLGLLRVRRRRHVASARTRPLRPR